MTFLSDAEDPGSAHEFEVECRIQTEQFLEDLIARRADTGNQPAINSDAIERAIKRLAAHGVENNRATAISSLRFCPGNKIGFSVINDDIRAQLPAKFQ